jgi:hypothetical protein
MTLGSYVAGVLATATGTGGGAGRNSGPLMSKMTRTSTKKENERLSATPGDEVEAWAEIVEEEPEA